MTPSKHIRIGVFIPETVQLLDLSPIDLFGMLDPKYLAACQLPAPLVASGIPSTIHYISKTSSGSHVELTAGAMLKVSKTTEDPEVQAGLLDILLVPGPDPSAVFDEVVLDFVRRHTEWRGQQGETTDILSVCTGCILLGQSGVLNGRKASGPRAIVPKLKKDFPYVKWVDDKRWVHDGNIWSSGGITNGQEMVSAYMREKFPRSAAEVVIAMADVGDKGIDYANGKTADTIWWLGQILKAWALGGKKV